MSTPSLSSALHNGTFSASQMRKSKLACDLPWREKEREANYRTRYLFNGKELDTETNLYYYGARYFEPKEILWYGSDPLREKYPFTSSYVYCNANPVRFNDPTGKGPEKQVATGADAEPIYSPEYHGEEPYLPIPFYGSDPKQGDKNKEKADQKNGFPVYGSGDEQLVETPTSEYHEEGVDAGTFGKDYDPIKELVRQFEETQPYEPPTGAEFEPFEYTVEYNRVSFVAKEGKAKPQYPMDFDTLRVTTISEKRLQNSPNSQDYTVLKRDTVTKQLR